MDPQQPESDPVALYQHALALHNLGKLAEAAALYQQMLRQFPGNPLLISGLGTIALQQGNPDEGITLLRRSLQAEPSQPMAESNLGLALRSRQRLDEALASFDRAIALAPDFPDAHNYRGIVLQDLQRPEEALASYQRAIVLKPDYAEAYNNRGIVLQDLGRLEEALASFDRAMALRPNAADTYSNRGRLLCDLERPEEALANCDTAIALKPDYAEAYNNRGNALQGLMRIDDALASYDRAIALKPDYAEAYNNRGTVYRGLNRLDKALEDINHAIALKTDYADAYCNKAHIMLLAGEFDQGWRLYEWRWKERRQKEFLRSFSQPLWLGEQSIAGKTLFIHSEQGFGDHIQFCRYVSKAEALGANVVIEVPRQLVSLVSTMEGNFHVVEKGCPPPSFDLHCPIMSLPLAFKTTVASIPASVPYLYADAQKQETWKDRLGNKTKPRIGLVWSGSATQADDHKRSMPFRLLTPLLQLPMEFHALQKEIRPEDAAVLSEFSQVQLHQTELSDFSDTAALIQEMDLVISVCTSVAHLAGAMGKPVWIMLASVADWRWLLDRADSPWYPTASLIRQPAIGDWSSVIEEVGARLRSEITPISEGITSTSAFAPSQNRGLLTQY